MRLFDLRWVATVSARRVRDRVFIEGRTPWLYSVGIIVVSGMLSTATYYRICQDITDENIIVNDTA